MVRSARPPDLRPRAVRGGEFPDLRAQVQHRIQRGHPAPHRLARHEDNREQILAEDRRLRRVALDQHQVCERIRPAGGADDIQRGQVRDAAAFLWWQSHSDRHRLPLAGEARQPSALPGHRGSDRLRHLRSRHAVERRFLMVDYEPHPWRPAFDRPVHVGYARRVRKSTPNLLRQSDLAFVVGAIDLRHNGSLHRWARRDLGHREGCAVGAERLLESRADRFRQVVALTAPLARWNELDLDLRLMRLTAEHVVAGHPLEGDRPGRAGVDLVTIYFRQRAQIRRHVARSRGSRLERCTLRQVEHDRELVHVSIRQEFHARRSEDYQRKGRSERERGRRVKSTAPVRMIQKSADEAAIPPRRAALALGAGTLHLRLARVRLRVVAE